ncbi:hypothetical protein KP79_PYT18920 [Mizuhopecten yessoensis]|uniref:Uncharacterized protein n=2 Tax=Mizuhopecten yessoensis TaxID=6573 RepID=A0A210QZT2_MIZYE|nr:hypothetical protein KP79_PYT18920 [Mizuhopecten yessoensis]
MAFQTQCCVLLTILITITAGVPVPSQNGDAAAASSSCSPCRTPKNLPKECIYEVMARDPNTGKICPYCINLCRSTIKTVKESVIPGAKRSSKTALGNVPSKTKSVVSTKSESSRITKKSKKERKTTKTKSKSKRRSSRRNKSKKSSRRSKSASGKVTSNVRSSNKKNKIQNKAATGRQSLLKKSKRRNKAPSVRLAYGQSTPDKVSPLVRSSKAKTSRDGISHLKTSQVNSRRSRVRSTDLQPTDSFANEPLGWSPSRDRSYLSSSKYSSNKRNRVRNSGRSLNREPSISGQNYYPANHDSGYNTVNNGAWNGYYDNGYDNSYDSRENGRDDDRSDDDDWSAQGHIGGWDDSYDGNDRSSSNENDSHSDSFENLPRTGRTMAKTSMQGGSSSAENNDRSPVRNNNNNGWSGSDQSSSENGSNSSEDDR